MKFAFRNLLERASVGDSSAKDELFEKLSVRFKYLAKRRVGEDNAADLAQDAVFTVLEKYKSLEPGSEFEPWAYMVLRNKIGNYLKQKERREHIFGTRVSQDGRLLDSESAVHVASLRLRECLQKLIKSNTTYARVLVLAYQGFKTIEICEKLDIKANYFYVILNRSRSQLIACLEKGSRVGR